MKCLELFSGTGSFNKVIKELDWENISLDLSNKFKPDINIDILEWNYKIYPPNYSYLYFNQIEYKIREEIIV